MEPEQTGERRVDVAYDGQTLPILWVAYKMPAFAPTDRTRVAAELLAELAFGETSEAYRRLVLDEQVVSSSTRTSTTTATPGCSTSSTRVKDPAKVDYVLGVIDATIASLRASAARRARASPIYSGA